ncbi:MAG: hypothetical protein HQ510_09045 [Candidatus Marinimicrobia bacterium]|nr:hypothetical protein [Candidatus Neomarinimicrobiota bacterium]
MIIIILILLSMSFTQDIEGCTENGANNFNPDATIEDCSCEYEQYFTYYGFGCCGMNLIVFSDVITSLQSGDQIGIFDLNGLISFEDCSNQYGEILVGMDNWRCEELPIIADESVDNCTFGGVQFPGSIDGHQIHIRVYRGSEQQEYYAMPIYQIGFGYFGAVITVISELQLIPADESFIGCTEPEAYNFSPEALFENYSCWLPMSGDFDLNDTVNVIDIVLMVDFILFTELGDLEFYVGDLDNDGELTVADLVILVEMILEG